MESCDQGSKVLCVLSVYAFYPRPASRLVTFRYSLPLNWSSLVDGLPGKNTAYENPGEWTACLGTFRYLSR